MLQRLHWRDAKVLNGPIYAVQVKQSLQSYLGILSHANQHTLSLALHTYGALPSSSP